MINDIGIIKIGQEILFDREKVNRSNTNGNFETYQLIRLISENNKQFNFYILSQNDILGNIENLHNAYQLGLMPSTIILFAGITTQGQFALSDEIYEAINTCQKLVIISTDPRCLDSTLSDKRITKKPNFILSQFEGIYQLKYYVNYIPLETATSYKSERQHFQNKTTLLSVIANSSGNEYNRINILSYLLFDMNNIDIYGRISKDEQMLLEHHNYNGEVEYKMISTILKNSSSTILIPIEKNMITSKYVESIMYNTIPIFYKDYNTSLLNVTKRTRQLIKQLTISDSSELKKVLENLKNLNENEYRDIIDVLYKELIEPYVDGKKLSEMIMEYVI
jgi:hypothetical protein